MIETKRHKEAFQKYYEKGDGRSLEWLASVCKVAVKNAKKWSVEFHWQERIRERDIEYERDLNERLKKRWLDFKEKQIEKFIQDIDDNKKLETYPKAALNTALDKEGKPHFNVESVKDMKDVIQAWMAVRKNTSETFEDIRKAVGDPDKQQIEHSGEVDFNIQIIMPEDDDGTDVGP